jgi:hypothetical protein
MWAVSKEPIIVSQLTVVGKTEVYSLTGELFSNTINKATEYPDMLGSV